MPHADADRFTVQVHSGLYAGVVETLPAGRYTVGSSLDADLVFIDDDLAPFHFVVDTLGPSLRIEALAEGVQVHGVCELKAGEARTMRLPVEIMIGGTRLSWHPVGPEAAPRSRAGSRLLRRAVGSHHAWVALTILFGSALFFMANPVADASIWGGPASPPAAEQAAVGATSAVAPEARPSEASAPPLPTLPARIELKAGPRPDASSSRKDPRTTPQRNTGGAAADALRAEIEKAGLLNIAVEPGTGVVTATGTVEPAASARWQGVQQWFDERFGGELTLVNGVSMKAEKLPVSLAIEAVWRGQHPHLIIRGQKYLEGAMLEGGWAIQRIEGERVLLQREGRMVAVRY